MASKRIRKPPMRYVEDVESPFVNRISKAYSRSQQETDLIGTKECGNDDKTKAQQCTSVDAGRTVADTSNVRSRGKSSRKSTKSSNRTKTLSTHSDDNREKPDFYSSSSEMDLDMCSMSSEDKTFDLPDSSVEDFCEEDEEFQMCSEESRELTFSGVSSSVLDDIPICPWIEISPDRLPRLDLPSGSKDLLIDESLLFDVLEIYETCRNFYRTIRLSPFLFEDFCAALISDEQSLLLAEIHIAFLKLALKNDEEEQVTLSVQDTNNSFNIITHLIEPMTYAEVLRQYVESDMKRFPSEVLNALDGNYPFVDVRRRITVLSWLCDRFLHSADFRSIVRNDGKFNSDEYCRECGKQGDVLLCDGCEACYHLSCANLETVPEGQWFCQVCVLHQVTGVTDSGQLSSRNQRLPFRLNPLGYDRHGRRYWFAVRRIFVQDDVDNSISYYSTLPQLHSLLSRFAVGDLEKELSAAIMNLLPVINEEMRKTQQLTENAASRIGFDGETYLVSENCKCK
uniref:Nucleosome-remodeling factor subunit NURF301 n=1 Tax=Syphacia muris TaxID=451379 RepID=A0A0N5B0D9_9BILA